MADENEIDLKDAKVQAAIAAAVEAAIGPLKAKNEELLGETKEAKRKAREEAEAAKLAVEEAARKSGDVAALEKSWQDKLAAREAELSEAVKARDAQLVSLTVGATAQKLAADLAVPGSADVLLPHIKSRLSYADGKLSVLDADGKPSAATVDELAKEIASNKAFAPLIVASLATGGGASGGKGGGAAPTKKVAEWTDGEKARFIREQGLPAWQELLKAQG